MKNRLTRTTAIVSGLTILVGAIVVVSILEIEKSQFRRNARLSGYEAGPILNSGVLVVYFSRSGNTVLMAEEIAKHHRATLLRLEANDYRIGLRGWINALWDSQTQRATITPGTLDLKQYHTIFVGSPIWWYSPAPPIWQFVGNNHIDGKNIILFNTFNSRFKQEYIDLFKDMVESKGGVFAGHLYVKRGRMTMQIDAQTMLKQVRELLESGL